jgi:hypothetical protein
MPRSDVSALAIHYDAVHIISVNSRGEARLFENGGAKEGTLIFKSDEPAAKAATTDAMGLVDMALRYGISYELISRTADASVQPIFERLGVKTFLDRVIAMTTEQERHQRFEGFEFSFAKGSNGEGQPEPDAKPEEKAGDATAKKKAAVK